MPRKKRATSTLAARDTYHVVGPSGDLAVKGPAGPQDPGALALVVAQAHAITAPDPIELRVERRTLFGPPVTLYRVVLDAEGVVKTFTVNHVD
jgi:hypothetical protein